MRPLRYSINVTLDGCCDHRAIPADDELHHDHTENLGQADALLFGRVTYEMMEEAWRGPAETGVSPDWMEPWMEPFAREVPIDEIADTIASYSDQALLPPAADLRRRYGCELLRCILANVKEK